MSIEPSRPREEASSALAAAIGPRAGSVSLRTRRAVQGAREELARIDSDDNGTPVSEMEKDVDIAAAQLRYFAGLALHAEGKTIPTGYDRVNLHGP